VTPSSTGDPLAAVPRPAERRLALRVTRDAQRVVRGGHPWLFDRGITDLRGEGAPGDLAVIFDDRRRFLAIGLYDPTSPIRVRVLQHGEPTTIDRSFLHDRLAKAADWRAGLPGTGTTGYRVVNGENDGLPGLVIDRYDATLVLKIYTLAWLPWLADLRAALDAVMPARSVVLRLSRDVGRRTELLYGLTDGVTLSGETPEGSVRFTENGLRFEADVVHGQKTGFYLDQRENRARVEHLASGRRTLNAFAYTGGFSLYAARGGAPEIVSLDASSAALAAAERNFALNRDIPAVAAARHSVLVADAFAALADLRRDGNRFEMVVVDPPALAVQESQIAVALRAYERLVGLALGVLAPGGVLVAASCSARIGADTFFEAVHRAAGRPLTELERTGHPLDHPVRFPEGAYLKCLFARAA